MRTVVTGGTGFLGSHLVRLLQARGAEVGVLLRPGTSPDRLPEGVTHEVGDIRDAAALQSAFAGADVVFHLAALTAPWGPRPRYLDINVGGTEAVVDACRTARAGRLGFLPPVDFAAGIAETVAWYRKAYPEGAPT